ncbi:MAG: hypothetical protein ACLTMP_00360 [Eggerthella lenta]
MGSAGPVKKLVEFFRVRRRSRLPAAGYPSSRTSPAARAWTSRCPTALHGSARWTAGAKHTVEVNRIFGQMGVAVSPI